MTTLLAAALLAAAVTSQSPAPEGSMTLDEAIARARERAPAILAARARVEEARGRLSSASVRLRDNPVLAAAAGPRSSDQDTTVDLDVEVSQSFEPGGGREARVAGARADLERESAAGDDAARRLLRDVGVTFLRALHAEERLRLAGSTEVVDSELVRVAQTRHDAGEITILDVNVARASLARSRSAFRAQSAARSAALGALRTLLGMEPEELPGVSGELADRRLYEVSALLQQAPDRPDLRALAAEGRRAEADLRVARSLAFPGLGLGIRYEREGDDDVVLGAVMVTLPVFDRGAGARAEAAARAERMRFEREAGQRAAISEVRAAHEVYRARVEAVEELEAGALPLLDDNDALARAAYEAGQLGLGDLLTIRRESLGTKLEYLDQLLEAAVAGIELEFSAGVLR